MSRRYLLLCLLLLVAPVQAVIESYDFADEEMRERYRLLSAELRCPKCQNQNIADSNAPIAADLRAQLHEQLHAGRSNDEIVEYMVDRYGEFVLYRPRWNQVTMVLWLAPVILLGLALWVLLASIRNRKAGAASVALSEAEQQRLQALLADTDNGASQDPQQGSSND
ncbi:MAG: cytochrome c-type biogenesis protein [Halieaceae bacterium]